MGRMIQMNGHYYHWKFYYVLKFHVTIFIYFLRVSGVQYLIDISQQIMCHQNPSRT